MFKLSALALLAVASSGLVQTPRPEVRFVLTHAEAQALSHDPSAVLADPSAVAALAAFLAPMQQHTPPDPNGGVIGAFFEAGPDSFMMPVTISGALLWVSVSIDAPEDAYPPEMEGGSELVWDRYVVDGDDEALTDAQAVCPPNGAGYRVWDVAGVGPVEGCVSP